MNVRQALPTELLPASSSTSNQTWSSSRAFAIPIPLEGGAKDEKVSSRAHSILSFVLSGSLLAGSAEVPARGRGSVTHA